MSEDILSYDSIRRLNDRVCKVFSEPTLAARVSEADASLRDDVVALAYELDANMPAVELLHRSLEDIASKLDIISDRLERPEPVSRRERLAAQIIGGLVASANRPRDADLTGLAIEIADRLIAKLEESDLRDRQNAAVKYIPDTEEP